MVCSLAKHQRNTRTDPAIKFNGIKSLYLVLLYYTSHIEYVLYIFLHRFYFVDSFADIAMDLAGIDYTSSDSGTTEFVAEIVHCERRVVALVG